MQHKRRGVTDVTSQVLQLNDSGEGPSRVRINELVEYNVPTIAVAIHKQQLFQQLQWL